MRLPALDVKAFQTAYRARGNEIGNLINTKFGTHYSGGHFVSRSSQEKESLASLLPLDEILSPLRRQTVHTLLSRFLGTLELGQEHSFDYYSDDKVTFNIEYWNDLLTVYTENDRQFLGQDTGLFYLEVFHTDIVLGQVGKNVCRL